ncbi:hypothetical protein MESS2_650122 [Mesorhizobium metallidurans STM 2683]|uniref:Uncharacterized protein n=1 Tax=Mesorhizobium metallidurans STM 2683 TaxID=1297569 RepID=M5EUK0_9HYPH|nr:hypothetical protein MESS2_650122 [Mesorhizobium metallidurans STM 2683]
MPPRAFPARGSAAAPLSPAPPGDSDFEVHYANARTGVNCRTNKIWQLSDELRGGLLKNQFCRTNRD